MPEFRYKHGDRPLEGYTIQHAAGRGGFGEVYYAISDSGREVALKVIQGYEQIELRGVSQCMNLKSPHLVTIFDVKHNAEGTPFVIMEYVSGPSLRQIIDETPSGLGTQKAAFFLREIGKGLSYLHECGIVHRDLKPGNIFYENGYVKIGDYGLSKAIGPTPHSQQTVTVGTVHYMAPEVGVGRYDKGIDIYALGAVLYEMLTGQVPYLGASPAEVLMKHLTAEPDLRNIEEPFATVIRKAMARDPKDRYQNVQEMIEAVFGSAHIRESVSCFSPDSLSMVAARAAAHVHLGGSSTPQPWQQDRPVKDSGDFGARVGAAADRFGQRMAEFGDRMAGFLSGGRVHPWRHRMRQRMRERFAARGPVVPAEVAAAEARDPLPGKQRGIMAIATIALIAVGAGLVAQPIQHDPAIAMVLSGFMGLGAFIGLMIARKKLIPKLSHESPGVQRLAVGGVAAFFSLIAAVIIISMNNLENTPALGWWLPVAAGLLVFNWKIALSPTRMQRVRLGHVIAPCVLGFFLTLMLAHGNSDAGTLVIGALAGAGLAAQIASPWDPFARSSRAGEGTPAVARLQPPPVPMPVSPDAPTMAIGAAAGAGAVAVAEPVAATSAILRPGRPVPRYVRWIWLLLMATAIPGGIVTIVAAQNHPQYVAVTRIAPGEMAMTRSEPGEMAMTMIGVGELFLALLFLIQACRRRFTNWWSYIFKPLSLYACLQVLLLAAARLSESGPADDRLKAIFLLIFSGVLFLIVLMMPTGSSTTAPKPLAPPTESQHNQMLHEVRSNFVLSFFGSIFVLAAIALGILTAVDVPGCIAAGIFDPRMPNDLTRAFGNYSRWPEMLRIFGCVATFAVLFLGAAMLMAARRPAGAMHVIRVPLALIGFVIAMFMLWQALPQPWQAIREAGGRINPAASIDLHLRSAVTPLAIGAGVAASIGLLLIMWPPRRISRIFAATQQPEVSQ